MEPEIAIPNGVLNPLPALAHPVNTDPDTVHAVTVPALFATNAVEPEIVIPSGLLNPLPVEAHPVNVDPVTVHAVTSDEP